MAETKIKASATPAPAAGESLTAAGGAAATMATAPVAESLDDFLDRAAVVKPAQAQDPSGDENPVLNQTGDEADDAAGDTAAETDDSPKPAQDGDEHTADDDAAATAAADANATAQQSNDAIGQFERGVLDKLKEAKIPEALQKRIAKSFEKEIKNRKLISERDTILQSKDTEIETLKSQLSEAGTKVTMAPSGPLAQFDTPEKLNEASARAADFIQWVRNPDGRYRYEDDPPDTPGARTADEKIERHHEWALNILANAPLQQQVLTQKQTAREALKKEHPELFDNSKEESKRLQKLYATDPRTQPDFDQLISDAERGRRMREDEASGDFKYHRINLNDARANGALGGTKANGTNGKNGTHANGSNGHQVNGRNGSPAVTLPVPRQSSVNIPTRATVRSPLESLKEKAEHGGHGIDDYLDATAGA